MPHTLTTVFSPKFEKWVFDELEAFDRRVVHLNIVGARHRGIDPESHEFDGPLVLMEEPENKHDRNAIMVLYGGQHVGYIERAKTMCIHGRWFNFNQNSVWSPAGVPKVVSGIGWTMFILEEWRV
jgi:hypothetical protein